MPHTLTRAAFTEMLRTSGVALLVLVGLFWLLQSLKWLDLLVNKGLSPITFAQLSGYLLPYILVFTLPLAVLFGAVFVAKRWQEEAEAFALYGAGVPPWRLGRGAMLFGVCCSVVLAMIMHIALPISQQKLQTQRQLFLENQTELTLQPATFNTFGRYTVFIEKRTSDFAFQGLIVHEIPEKSVGGAESHSTTWAAQSGELTLNARTGASELLLKNGVRQTLTPEGQQRLSFDAHTFALSSMVGNLASRRLKTKERTWAQLAPSEALSAREKQLFKAERNKRLAWPWLPLALMMLALSFILQPRYQRTGCGRQVLKAVLCGFGLVSVMFFLESQAEDGLAWALWLQLVLPVAVLCIGLWRLWPQWGGASQTSLNTMGKAL